MRFILTCGGSGGHINPALAVARVLRAGGSEVLFIGAPQGLESDLVPREGYDLETVNVRPLSHRFSIRAMLRNAAVAAQMPASLNQARQIIKRFKPNAVLGTGGYASFPALYAASLLKIPVLVHESNAFPGVTTRRIAKRARAVLVGTEACRAAYKYKDKVHVTGTPSRPEFFSTHRFHARELLKLDNRPLVVSVFGSQGARDMNRIILDMMCMEKGDWQHIHAAGPKRYDGMKAEAGGRGLAFDGNTGLKLTDYIYNMAETCAAADIIICRAGAATIADLCAAGKPALLIPSPNVAADHQTANAKLAAGAGGAILLPEAGLTAEKLYQTVKKLLDDRVRLEEMGRRMSTLAVPDSAQKIAELLYRFAGCEMP